MFRECGFVDSSVVVCTLQTTKDESVVGRRLIQKIHQLLALKWEVKICHSYRETNSCTYALANIGCEHASRLRVHEQFSIRLSSLVLADVMEYRCLESSLFSFLFSRT